MHQGDHIDDDWNITIDQAELALHIPYAATFTFQSPGIIRSYGKDNYFILSISNKP